MIQTAPSSLVRNLRVPGYVILAIATLLPALDLLVSVMPLRPSTVVWRFGFVGLFSSAIGAPLLLLFFIYVLALFAGDRKITVLVGVVAAIITFLLVAAAGAFILDALQMRQRIQPAAQTRFMTATVQAMLKLALEGLASLVLAISVFRSLRAVKVAPVARTDSGRSGSPLLVNRPSARQVVADTADPAPRAVEE